MSESSNPMLSPSITKVTVNIGVGEGGRRLQLAERVLEVLTGMTPSRTLSTKTNRDLGTRKGAPIGCKVTIRDHDKVECFLKDAFWVRDHTLPAYNFDISGNLSFGFDDLLMSWSLITAVSPMWLPPVRYALAPFFITMWDFTF